MAPLDSGTSPIPVIDLSSTNPKASQQLFDAAAKHGFVFIENDSDAGISTKAIDDMFELSTTFFKSPVEVKDEVSINANTAGKNLGWLSRGRADVKEAFNLGEPHGGKYEQPIPTPIQPHIDTIISFQQSCHSLCQLLLRHFAIALNLAPDWFTSRHDPRQGPSSSVFRLLYYPRASDMEDAIDIRAGAHSDYGSITLLFQLPGQPGLEILTPEGKWVSVPVDPTGFHGQPLPILVNIGDLLSYWTNGLLKSTVHRVVFPPGEGADRYSIAYFCHPLDDAELIAVPSAQVEALGGKEASSHVDGTGMGMTARDHLNERLAATYSIMS